MVNKVKKRKIYLIFAFLLVLIGAYLLFLTPKIIVNTISSGEFENLIKSEEVFVINTHTPYVGEIDGTDLIAEGWDNMKLYQDQLPEDKNTPIAVYCKSGNMAETSTTQLIKMGYKKVYNLEGGMNAWENSGRSIFSGD